jgi:lipoprotein-anchoring transpeptidase ErfK/SrfK
MRVEIVLRRVLPVALVLAVALGTGTAGSAATRLPTSTAVAGCSSGSIHGLRTSRLSYAASVLRSLAARRTLAAAASERFDLRNANGVRTVFGVLAARVDRTCRATDYRVQLPIRPNGSTGWVRAADVRLVAVRTRISVDLSQKRITLFRDGQRVLVAAAAIGAPSTPTPTGRFYVNQRLLSSNPIGDYGPGAVGISAFSPVLLHWPQGGPIAIHGTNAPDMVGFAISHGCLRVRNIDIRKLLSMADEGTPVEIRR